MGWTVVTHHADRSLNHTQARKDLYRRTISCGEFPGPKICSPTIQHPLSLEMLLIVEWSCDIAVMDTPVLVINSVTILGRQYQQFPVTVIELSSILLTPSPLSGQWKMRRTAENR